MSKNLNISVLVAARNEYIDQLKCIIVPLLLQGFNSIYQDAIKLSEDKKVIYKFQELLKQIPQWNQTILQEESKRIKKKCPYIMDIVTAIFVTNVKILASVRLKGSREDIRVKIPTSDIFIHGIYIESAQQIFYDPFLFYHRGSNFGKIQENKHHVKQIICQSVDETIRQMLPFDDILQKYLADALKDNAEFGEGSDDSEEESVSDSDEESVGGDDLPSDEEESEPDPDEHKIKSFNFGENGNNFEEIEPKENNATFNFKNDSDSDSDSEPDKMPGEFNEFPRQEFQPSNIVQPPTQPPVQPPNNIQQPTQQHFFQQTLPEQNNSQQFIPQQPQQQSNSHSFF